MIRVDDSIHIEHRRGKVLEGDTLGAEKSWMNNDNTHGSMIVWEGCSRRRFRTKVGLGGRKFFRLANRSA